MLKENMCDSLIHVALDFSAEYMKNIDLYLLELFYNIFACFDPDWLVDDGNLSFESLMKKQREMQKTR
jgi:hypothetical protein